MEHFISDEPEESAAPAADDKTDKNLLKATIAGVATIVLVALFWQWPHTAIGFIGGVFAALWLKPKTKKAADG